ncbi:uncharacterized protein LOC132192602 [Neocloeon triangulifer]|uniref:uncharacterized protein LOC132192602 n=1 Tax=Neocloeon triangulifer TaxID=2078957 RepID=UPI00286F8DBD|nr:uncharacterized protein LOC132192602 [Neocloeon triangulifer]
MQFSSTSKILLIFILLKILMVETLSKNVEKLDRMKSSRAEKTKNARRYIVKCCGKYSCSEGRKRNSTQINSQNNLDKSKLGSGSEMYNRNSNSKIDQVGKSGQNNGNTAVGGGQIISNEGQGNSLTTSSNDAIAADQTNVQGMSQNANSDGSIDPIAGATMGLNSGDAGSSGTSNPSDPLAPLPIGGAGGSFETSTSDPNIVGSDLNGLNNPSLPSFGNGSKNLATTNGPGLSSQQKISQQTTSQQKVVQQTSLPSALQTNLSTRAPSSVIPNSNNSSGSSTSVVPLASGINGSTGITGVTVSKGGTVTTVKTTQAQGMTNTTVKVLPVIGMNLTNTTATQNLIKCANFIQANTDYESYLNAVEVARAKNETSTTTTKAPGTLIPACGRVYFFGKNPYNVLQASKACMSRGMALLALETLDEKSCLLSIASKVITMATKYWTTISNEGVDLSTYYQCSSNFSQSFPDEFRNIEHWASTSVKDPNQQRCLGFTFNTTVNGTRGFFHEDCKLGTMPYICEPLGQQSTCPTQCKANPAVFEPDGKLKNAASYGYWNESCGKKYLFGNKLLNWDENWDMCCSLGMQPVAIESEEEQKCLSNLTATDWKYNFNYWTGGTQRGCFGQWRWCGSGSSVIKSGIRWAPGQPDNLKGNQSCLHMQISKDVTLGLGVTDRNCTDNYVFACQGSPKMDLPCDEPECPNGKCTRNATLFSGNNLINFNNYGIWTSGCNRHFLFSKDKVSWKNARDNCCQIGMTVVSVESIFKHQCLVEGLAGNFFSFTKNSIYILCKRIQQNVRLQILDFWHRHPVSWKVPLVLERLSVQTRAGELGKRKSEGRRRLRLYDSVRERQHDCLRHHRLR